MALKTKPNSPAANQRQAAASAVPIVYRDAAGLDPVQLLALYHQAPWAKTRSVEDARTMLANTDVAVTAWDGTALVGFSRVLTDYVYRATIWDVIVDQQHQGQGIGTELVQRLLHHPKLARVELFWLCTRRPGFYERLGFTDKAQTGMVWVRAEQAREE